MKKPVVKNSLPPAAPPKRKLIKLKKKNGTYEGRAVLFDDPWIGCQYVVIAPDSGMLQRAINAMKVRLDVKRLALVNINFTPRS